MRKGGRSKLKQNCGRGEAKKKKAMSALAPHRQQQPTNLNSLGDWKAAYLELRRLFPKLRVGSRESTGQIDTLLVLYCPSQGPPERAPAVVKGKPVVYEKCDICGQGDKLNTAGGCTFEEEQTEEKKGEDSDTNTLTLEEEEEACPECSSVACATTRRKGRQIVASVFGKELKDATMPCCRERHLDYLGDWKEAFLELRRVFPRMPVSAKTNTLNGEIYTLQVLYGMGGPPENAPTVVKGKPVVYEKGVLVDSCDRDLTHFREDFCLHKVDSPVNDVLREKSASRWSSEIGDSRKAWAPDGLPDGSLGAVNTDRGGTPVDAASLGFCVPPTAAQLSGDLVTASFPNEEEQKEEKKEKVKDSTLEKEEACPECSSVACATTRRKGRQVLASMFRKELKDITMPCCRERYLDYLGEWKEAFLELQRLFPNLTVSTKKTQQEKGEISSLLVLYDDELPDNPPAVVKGKPVVYSQGICVDS